MDKNNITVIDTDLYCRSNCSLDYLREINNDALYRMFINLFYCTLSEKHSTTYDDSTYLTKLFDCKEGDDTISKKLVKYKLYI